MKDAGTVLKLLLSLITRPSFRSLLETLDYLQIVAYTEKDDLAIIFGHFDGEKRDSSFACDFLNAIRKISPSGLLQMGENQVTLTFFLDKKAKEEVKKYLA